MDTSNNRSVIADGREIKYFLERKRVKNLNLRIRKDGTVFVSANQSISNEEIDKFVSSKADYIIKAIEHFAASSQYRPCPKQYVSGETFYIQGRSLRLQVVQADKEVVSSDGIYIYLEVKDTNDYEKKKKIITRFLELQCKKVMNEILEELYPQFQKYGIAKPKLRIREMKTRWGSCLVGKEIITLNRCLLEAPRICTEYVMMHELCHFVYPNHSNQFYAFLTMLMPDWKERKKILEQNAKYWL